MGLYCGHHCRLLRLVVSSTGQVRSAHPPNHSRVQFGRNCRKLWRGLVRDPGQHVREFPDCVRFPARQAISRLSDSARSGHEHRHDADLCRTADHADHPAVCSGRLCRAVLHRIRDRRIAGRGGSANCGRHLHQDCRHWVGLDEDRVQDQGRRCAQPGRDRRLHGR